MTLRFVLDDSRFWEVRRDSKEVFARWGEGVDVKTRTVSFKNTTAAERELKRLIAKVQSLGYRPAKTTPVTKRRAASTIDKLIAALTKDPDDDEPLAVYGDELLAHHDLRGELAALVAAGRQSQVLRFVRAHEKELFGAAASDLEARHVTQLEWAPGFLRRAVVHEPTTPGDSLERVTKTLLASKAGELLRGLHFDFSRTGWSEVLKATTHSGHPELIVDLKFCPCDWSKVDLEEVDSGDFGDQWSALPQLRDLHLVASAGSLGVLKMPELRSFSRRGGGFCAADVRSLKAAQLPRLQKLELGFQVESRCSVDEVLLAAFKLNSPIEHLALRQLRLSTKAIEALAGSAQLKRLKTLDLSDALVTEKSAQVLLDAAEAFEHVRQFAPPWLPDPEGNREEPVQTELNNQVDYVDVWEA